MNESVIEFGNSNKISGVLTTPSNKSTSKPCIILLNAGLLHKIGPYRLNVDLARNLSEKSFYSFRFDFSGIGDSENYQGQRSFEDRVMSEIDSAVETLKSIIGINSFVLIGMCSGADVAFSYILKNNHKISDGILINGYFIDDSNSSEINEILQDGIHKRYYLKKLLYLNSWYNIISGKANFRNISKLFFNKKNDQKLYKKSKLSQFELLKSNEDVDLLLVFSEGSSALDTYETYHKVFLQSFKKKNTVEVFKNVDHTFTPTSSRDLLIKKITDWLIK